MARMFIMAGRGPVGRLLEKRCSCNIAQQHQLNLFRHGNKLLRHTLQ